jgi:uncharacterized membrane protein
MIGSGKAGASDASGGWTGIARRVRESDHRRQAAFNRSRRALVEATSSSGQALPKGLLPEYLKALIGSVIAFWILSALLSLLHARPLYTLAAFGLFYSLQATYYKVRLAADPDFRIPGCGCRGGGADDSEAVLRSGESAILGVPNSVLGAVLYPALVLLAATGHADAALALAILALAASAWLARVMIVRIRGLCLTCINIAALNLLLLWQLLR